MAPHRNTESRRVGSAAEADVRRGAMAMVLMVVVAACTGEPNSTSSGESRNPSVSSSVTVAVESGNPEVLDGGELLGAAGLICDGVDRPCSWGDAGVAVLDSSWDLGQSAYDRYAAGESLYDIATDLADDPGMASLLVDDQSLVFRLEGGLAVWVVADSLFENTRAAPRPLPAAARRIPFARVDVVGTDPEAKSALVLSPYKFEWEEDDEGAEVAALYESARGYEGNVTYLANTAEEVQVLSQAFYNWDDYDVVHLSTHGLQNCDGISCRTGIFAGFTVDTKTILLEEAGGMTVSFSRGGRIAILGDDFFRHAYPGGLPDTVIVLSACETALGTDLTTALGPGVVFGWTQSVKAEFARPAALALHGSLIEYGTTTDRALDDVAAAGLDVALTTVGESSPTSETWVRGADGRLHPVPETRPGGDAASGRTDGPEIVGFDDTLPDLEMEISTRLVRRASAEDDLRVREVAWIDNPQAPGPLEDGTAIRARVAADADYLPVKLRVEGIDPGDEAATTLTLIVDGVEADSWSLAEASATGRWGEWVVQDEVRLLNRIEEDDEVDLELIVDLPEGGESKHSVDQIRLECLVGEWRLRADEYVKALFEAAGGAEEIDASHVSGEYRIVARADGTYTGFRDAWTLRLSTPEASIFMTIDSEDSGTWRTSGDSLIISEPASSGDVTLEVEVDGRRVAVGGSTPVSVDAVSGSGAYECAATTLSTTNEGITANFDRISP